MWLIILNTLFAWEVSFVRSNLEQIDVCLTSPEPVKFDRSFVCFNEFAPCKIDISDGTKAQAEGSEFGSTVQIKTVEKSQFQESTTIFSGQIAEGYPATREAFIKPEEVQVFYKGRTINSIDLTVKPGKIAKFQNSSVCVGSKSSYCTIHLSKNSGLEAEGSRFGAKVAITVEGCAGHLVLEKTTVLGKLSTADAPEPAKIFIEDIETKNKGLRSVLNKNPFSTSISERGVIVNIPVKYFKFDSSQLTVEGKKKVQELAQQLGRIQGRSIAVEGHTDDVNSEEYNKEISTARAKTVAKLLNLDNVKKVEGVGSEDPLYKAVSSLSGKLNNRVEVIIQNFLVEAPEEELPEAKQPSED